MDGGLSETGMLKKMLRNYDYTLVVPVLLLCGFGLLMVYSSGMSVALDAGLGGAYYFKHQMFAMAVALVGFAAAMLFPYQIYQKLMKLILVVSLISLVAVLFFGTVSNHAQSWINIAGFKFQPSEFVKLGLIIYLAAIFSKKQHYISNFTQGVMPPLIIIILTFILIAIQPDMGTAMIVAGTAGILIVCSGMRIKHLLALLGLAVTTVSLLFIFLLSSVQASRFTAAYDPFSDPNGKGLQLINSYIAIASGGFTGKGLGESIQKYGFLPEAHTDFIMAIIAEEFGLLGVLFVIGLLAYIVFRGFMTGIHCKDTFGSLLAIGISGMIGVQALVNLGAITGLLPVTGVTLPFISYGGSSLVLSMFAMGVLVNISMFVNLKREQSPEERKDPPESSYRSRPYIKGVTPK